MFTHKKLKKLEKRVKKLLAAIGRFVNPNDAIRIDRPLSHGETFKVYLCLSSNEPFVLGRART